MRTKILLAVLIVFLAVIVNGNAIASVSSSSAVNDSEADTSFLKSEFNPLNKTITVITGEKQEFNANVFDKKNNSLKIEWFVNEKKNG